tara:strand:+ start:392 stop:1549 length:1158 start_codon:yes stop_codon:yes gene_type:complete
VNNINLLRSCRGCGCKEVIKAWQSPPLPIHLWPYARGTKTFDQRLTAFICKQCGLVQLNDMSESFVEHLYDFGVCVCTEYVDQVHRKAQVLDWAGENFYQDKNVLELGAGNNTFISTIPEARERWIADFKPEDDIYNIADKVITGNFENITLPKNKFDVICGYYVYEHFINPLEVTRQIRPALKDDGLLILEVPNLHFYHSDLPHYMFFHQHQTNFTLETLNFMMATAKFECKVIFSNGKQIYAGYVKNDLVEPISNPSEVKTALLKVKQTGKLLGSIARHVEAKTNLLNAKKLSLYGAGGSMSLFLAYSHKLRVALSVAFDKDVRKHGRYVPGTNAKVLKPSEMKTSGSDLALVIDDELSEKVVGKLIEKKITIPEILSKIINS